jgi:phosphate transport system substrate-binding protein
MTRRLLFVLFSASLPIASMAAEAGKRVVLNGAGSTFVYPILAQWIKAYQSLHPGIEIAYEPVGSGRGISRVLAGTVDFGASDGPMTDLQIRHARTGIVHIPVILGAVVPAYSLPGVDGDLKFTPATLAGIFLGRIKRWDDPELVLANAGLRLPDRAISVVFRTDGSGTTYVWTDYLSKVSPEWKQHVGCGTSVSFPVGTGAQFNEGVVDLVKKTPYSIGYLQLTYALENHVQFGRVENSSGVFVKAASASITAAAAATATEMPADYRVSITNAADVDAFPISSFSWLLAPARIEDPVRRQTIAGFIRWILTDGQKFAGPMNYAALPGDVAQRILRTAAPLQ